MSNTQAAIDVVKAMYEQDKHILKIIAAVKKCFPNPLCTDGALLVSLENYNALVDVINKGIK